MSIFFVPDSIIKKSQFIYDQIDNKFSKKFVAYVTNSKYRKAVSLVPWINKQVEKPGKNVKNILKSITNFKDVDDQAVAVLRFVKSHMKYILDSKGKFKRLEYWQTAEETLESKRGDCEDGAILIYVLCRLKGIPANRLYIGAGSVVGGGHAFTFYKPENYPMNYVILDWCYWYNSTNVYKRSLFSVIGKEISEFKPVVVSNKVKDFKKIKSNYKTLWFMFNEEKSFTEILVK